MAARVAAARSGGTQSSSVTGTSRSLGIANRSKARALIWITVPLSSATTMASELSVKIRCSTLSLLRVSIRARRSSHRRRSSSLAAAVSPRPRSVA